MKLFGGLNLLNMLFTGAMMVMAQQKISAAATCPCDIYNAAGTPCVAAYSTVRLLLSTYMGPLYQVRRTSDNATMDIYPLTGGTVADAAVQESFLDTGAGTISKLYDQSGRGNDLIKAPGGSQVPTPDNESNAKGRLVDIRGHKAYGLYMISRDGYRNNATNGMPTGSQPQGIYEVVDGQRYGTGCCWDFGNAETDNNAGSTGIMNAIFFGIGIWGKGAGSGPWFMGDFEAGVWSGGSGNYTTWNQNPSINYPYAFGIVKSQAGNYAIRVGSATSGNLITAWDGSFVTNWKMGGAIILGIGGDNSNSSYGTFFEGAITAGRPSNATDDAVLQNVQAAEYGVTSVRWHGTTDAASLLLFKVRYNPSRANAVISYTLQDARRVSMNIFNQQGRRIASVIDGIFNAGRHAAVWDAKRIRAGVYVYRVAIDGRYEWAGKIVIEK
jgi:non-reducing end alpha-L-arabinofuranosidase